MSGDIALMEGILTMKLSTSTNLLFLRPDNSIYPIDQAMKAICRAGFTELDMNFYDWATTPGSPYLEADWNAWLELVVEKAHLLGVHFPQSHAYFYDFADDRMDETERSFHEAHVMRSIQCAQAMGVETLVVHPCTAYGAEYSVSASKERNLQYYDRLLEKTWRYGVTFAIENMWDLDIAPKRKYCAVPEELAELVDAFHDDRIGACWDFEHGDLMQQDQPSIVRQLGARLKATHVSEQHGFSDLSKLHRLPMSGSIQWEPIMKALREIDYRGCFSYEVNNYLCFLPDSCIEPALRVAYLVGEHLMNMAG